MNQWPEEQYPGAKKDIEKELYAQRPDKAGILNLVLVGIAFVIIVFLLFQIQQEKTIRYDEGYNDGWVAGSRDGNSEGYEKGYNEGFVDGYDGVLNEFSLSHPGNGETQYYTDAEPLAPLEIEVPEGEMYYYIVLADTNNNQKIVSLFLLPGMKKEILVPLGTYKFLYGCGTQWFGDHHSFGPYGNYFSADEPCEFYLDKKENAYMGYTFTLKEVVNGNFRPSDENWEGFPR